MKELRWLIPALVSVSFYGLSCEQDEKPLSTQTPTQVKPEPLAPRPTPNSTTQPTTVEASTSEDSVRKNLVKAKRPVCLEDLEGEEPYPAGDPEEELKVALSEKRLKVYLANKELKDALMGVAEDPSDAEPKVSVSELMRSGAGDKGQVLRALASDKSADFGHHRIDGVIQKNLVKIQDCFTKALKKSPTLKGKVVMEWTISRTGAVTKLKVKKNTTRSKALATCMVREISRWKFPEPEDGTKVIVYPFTFNSISI